ncbi:MAG TPA: DinB family protein [Terriglobales bacterium]|nr:DinB family protein [Terriglobales bacterium]
MTGSELVRLYEFSYGALNRNLDGVTNEEGLIIPQPAGNCINWVLGHVVTARNTVLTLAGGDAIVNDEAATHYRRGSAALRPGDNVPDISTLRGWLADSQQQLIAALAAIPEEMLRLPVPEPLRRPPLTGTVGDALARLAIHESYHNGQIGLLRRLAGKPGAIA